jgi:Ca-activated chloride channel homolog
MLEFIDQLHFLRPIWLLALIPAVLIIWALLHHNRAQNQWLSAMDPHLLKHLLLTEQQIAGRKVSLPIYLLIALCLVVFALAGPTAQKRPLPVFESELSKVILLDLSLSMQAEDIKPSRLTRAKHKINDILSATNEGQVALIVYAGDAFVISPLTTDAKTIETLVPPLSPSLMPVLGSEPHRAFEVANELLTNAGVVSGQVIWLTDGIDDTDYQKLSDLLTDSRHQISILAIGTEQGAPIPLPDGQGFLKTNGGEIIIPSLGLAVIEQLAAKIGAFVTEITNDDTDINRLLTQLKAPEEFIASEDDLEMDTWIELGPYLLWPVLVIALFAFRKGLIIGLVCLVSPMLLGLLETSSQLMAAENETELAAEQDPKLAIEPSNQQSPGLWQRLWNTPDQLANQAFKANQYQQAATLFNDKAWRASSMYRAGQLNASAELLDSMDTADGHYNRGNALAKLGRLEEAIEAYQQALAKDPEMEDAEFNKKLVEELLKQQQQQQQDQQGDQDQDQQSQDQQQNQQGEQDQEQQSDQQQQQSNQEQQNQESDQQQQQENELDQMSQQERDQVLEQWLRKIKDDPGGLLRRKMYMEYQKRQKQGKELQKKGEKVW